MKRPATFPPAAPGLRRRTLLQAAAAFGPLAAAGLAPRAAFAAARYPLYLPPIVASPSDYGLAAAPAQVNFGPTHGAAWAYNHQASGDSFPGPTFAAAAGSSVSVAFTNGLPGEASSVHWHGMVVETAQDGQPQDVVGPGQGRRYAFPIHQRAALNWYHPHPHMDTGEQVCLGLAGAFIVRDAEEAGLGLPGGSYEVPLILRDANFDTAGNLVYKPRKSGFVGKLPLVNGTRSATLDVAPELYRLRVLNGANARLFTLRLSEAGVSRPFWLIGNDGGLLPAMDRISAIEFGPGERLDLLVDFRGLAVGTSLLLSDQATGWDLLEFVVAAVDGGVPATIKPKDGLPLSTITSLAGPDTPTRLFSFDGMSRINGKEYDMDRIDFTVPAGVVERWRFSTGGNAPHPVHVHGASFQVVSRSGGRSRLFPWEGGWKDTVLLKDNETVDLWIRFDGGYTGPSRGRYLLHCHKLEHEDMGMMANFVVV